MSIENSTFLYGINKIVLQFTGNVINLASSSGDLRQDMVTLRGNPGEIRYSDVRKWTFETWQL